MADVLSRRAIDELAGQIYEGRYIPRHLLRSLVLTARIFDNDRHLLARLAADTPQFSNPLAVYEAQQLRDALLSVSTPSSPGSEP
jgi:hypothetical protein